MKHFPEVVKCLRPKHHKIISNQNNRVVNGTEKILTVKINSPGEIIGNPKISNFTRLENFLAWKCNRMGCWIKMVRLFRANKTIFTVIGPVLINKRDLPTSRFGPWFTNLVTKHIVPWALIDNIWEPKKQLLVSYHSFITNITYSIMLKRNHTLEKSFTITQITTTMTKKTVINLVLKQKDLILKLMERNSIFILVKFIIFASIPSIGNIDWDNLPHPVSTQSHFMSLGTFMRQKNQNSILMGHVIYEDLSKLQKNFICMFWYVLVLTFVLNGNGEDYQLGFLKTIISK